MTPVWCRRALPALAGAAVFVCLILRPGGAYAHGGGLDKLGCHNDRKAGNKHCHQGPLAGQYFASKAEALSALGGGGAQPAITTGPGSVLIWN